MVLRWGAEPWMELAVCAQVDPELWFPNSASASGPAKRICKGSGVSPPCPVRTECLSYALGNDERFGVWGGLSEGERRKVKGLR